MSRLMPLLALSALAACDETDPPLASAISGPRFSLTSGAGLSSLKGIVAFHSNRTGDFEIYIMNADGSRVTQLTSNPYPEFDPTWSPDGKRIAVGRFDGTDFEVVVINADGSGERQLTDNEGVVDFPGAWSPDGKRIAFASDRDGLFGILVMNADGTGVTRLTNDGSPTAWSPDGRHILFSSGRTGNTDIFVMNADGTGVTQLTNDPATDDGARAGWSPDGKRIVFSSTRDGGDWDVFVMNADGTGVTQLTHNDFIADDDPVWSPDGKHIAFHSTRDGDEEIFVINADGTGATQLTFNEGIFDAVPGWIGGSITIPATQFHFVANGEFGSVNWTEVDPAGGFTFGFLSVGRGGPPSSPQTFLGYFVFQCDPFFSCNVILDGVGLIPNRDLSGGGRSLNLNTNTTGNPNFFTFTGPTGLVSVDWRANGLFTQSSSGTNQFSFPGFIRRSQGSFTSASANATGSIVGVLIPLNSFADIGTNHEVTIEIIH